MSAGRRRGQPRPRPPPSPARPHRRDARSARTRPSSSPRAMRLYHARVVNDAPGGRDLGQERPAVGEVTIAVKVFCSSVTPRPTALC